MRLIDADALMPLFMEKANTMKDRHGVKLGDEWLLNYNDIKDVIDNAPTIDDLSEYSDKLWQKAYERGKAEARPQGEWDYEKVAFYGVCSNCGVAVTSNKAEMFLYEEMREFPHNINFCPNCGADMRGGNDGT